MTDPTQPTEPTQPTDPTQPTEPAQAAPPVQPEAPLPVYEQQTPKKKASTARRVIVIAVTVVIFAIAFFGVRFIIGAFTTPAANSPEAIAETVELLKSQLDLPQTIDQVTTLDDITAEKTAVHYHYTIAGADTTALTDEALASVILPGICSQKATREVLDNDIGMTYSYVVAETGDEFHFEFTKADC